MHGSIFWELRTYAETAHGAGSWAKILATAGLEEKIYLDKPYPDSEVVALVTAAATLTGKTVPALLEDFGIFLAPFLLKTYSHLVRPEWRTLGILENAEGVIHGGVRRQQPGMAPPFLSVKRLGAEKMVLIYSSPRKMCAMAVGMVKGLGKHFQEEISVQHNACMHRGDASCELVIRSFPAAVQPNWPKAKSQKIGS